DERRDLLAREHRDLAGELVDRAEDVGAFDAREFAAGRGVVLARPLADADRDIRQETRRREPRHAVFRDRPVAAHVELDAVARRTLAAGLRFALRHDVADLADAIALVEHGRAVG